MKLFRAPRFPLIRLGLLTFAALAIHGYHLGTDDGEIYVPAARKLLHHNLYPYASNFFLSHERLSLFAPILASTARLTHLSIDWTAFLWYIVTLYATLAACWALAVGAFRSPRARWCAVVVITTVITMPAANTALALMDPYVTARSFSTPLTLFALALFLKRRYLYAAILTVVTAAIHPQMAAYLVFLAIVLWFIERFQAAAQPQARATAAAFFIALPTDFRLMQAPEPYREALYARDFYFLFTWTWYDWLGLIAPLAFLLWFWRGKLRGTTPEFARLSLALIPFGVLSILAAAIISSSHRFDMFARLQPLRSFHLITFVFILFLAGVIGEYWATAAPESLYPEPVERRGFLLKKKPPRTLSEMAHELWSRSKGRAWAIPALALPLAALMFVVQYETYPASPHIEVPWARTSPNAWMNALLWIRSNTPPNAVFAVDSRYFAIPGVDAHGFRAISGRAALADYYKDGGAVAIFPALAPEWKQQSNATYGLNHFTVRQFEALAREYPVNWTVVHGPAPAGMDCPYNQRGYAVCKIPNAQPATAQGD